MTPEFSALLQARFESLVASLQFDHKPTGVKRAVQVINPMLERIRGHEEGEEHPYLRWAICEGSFEPRKPQPFKVVVSLGLYTAGSIDDGNADIQSFTTAVGKIVLDRAFPPSRLVTPVPFTIGDPRDGFEGLQPHPYYYAGMILQFTTAG